MTHPEQAQQSFQMAKVFNENTGIVHSMDFSDDGKMLVTSSDDDSINLYNCTDGLCVLRAAPTRPRLAPPALSRSFSWSFSLSVPRTRGAHARFAP